MRSSMQRSTSISHLLCVSTVFLLLLTNCSPALDEEPPTRDMAVEDMSGVDLPEMATQDMPTPDMRPRDMSPPAADLAGNFFPFDQGTPPTLPPHGLAGQVTSTNGMPIAGASVRVFGQDGSPLAPATNTDAQGTYLIELDPTGPVTVEITANGYADGYERTKVREGALNALVSRIAPLSAAEPLDAARGGTIAGPLGFSLEIPPDAFVDQSGAVIQGNVEVHITPLDRREVSDVIAHPGDFIGRTADDVSVSLRAASTVDILVTQGGQRLELAPDKVIKATLPFLDGNAPEDGVRAYSYDERAGIWREEGRAIYDTNRRAFTLDILHFSYWMAASNIYDDTCLQGKLIDAQGDPVAGTQIRSVLRDDEDRGFSFTTHSDLDGNFAITWKKLARLKLQFLQADGVQIERSYIAGNGGVGILPPEHGLSTCLELEPIVVNPSNVGACPPELEATCDDQNDCTVDDCRISTCVHYFEDAGTPCGPALGGVCDGQGSCRAVACATECCEDADCISSDACTQSTCTPQGMCEYTKCGEAQVSWNDLDGALTSAQVINTANPLQFPIPLPDGLGDVNVTFSRTGNEEVVQPYTPPATQDGSFALDGLSEVSLAWQGSFPYIDVLAGGPSPGVNGEVRFSFDRSAEQLGSGWRYIIGVGGTSGSPLEGPTTITSSQPLELIGRFDAFGSGKYASFRAPSTILGTSGAGGADGLLFFLLPADAQDVTMTISDTFGAIPDPHGYVVGALNVDIPLCDAQSGQCLSNSCGDGLVRGGEACDDGNAFSGDGCSNICEVETPGLCSGVITTDCVQNICGNGKLEGPEECDDHNTDDSDGCSSDCAIEQGFACASTIDLNTGGDGSGGRLGLGDPDRQWEYSVGVLDAGGQTPSILPSNLTWQPARLIEECVSPWHDASNESQWINSTGWDVMNNTCAEHPTPLIESLRYYRVKFELASTSAAQSTTLRGSLWADNQLTKIFINGQEVTEYTAPVGSSSSFTSADVVDFGLWGSNYYQAGENELVLAVKNLSNTNTFNPEGLLVTIPNAQSDASVCTRTCATECCSDAECDDQRGCTLDTCDATGSCVFQPLCERGQVVWNDLSQLIQDGGHTFTTQTPTYTIPIPTPDPTQVIITRDDGGLPGDQSISPFTSIPAAANNGLFNALNVNTSIRWRGAFDYINIEPAGLQPNSGTVTFDFQKAATDNGAGWYYVLGISALGSATQGPMTITSSEELQYLGALDVWTGGVDPKLGFDQLAPTTLQGPAGGANTALEFYLVPQSAHTLTMTLDNTGNADPFGMWVGAVNIGQTCSAYTPAGMCMLEGISCGDGIKTSIEACDDGNSFDGDGCSSSCTIEANSTCVSIATSFCNRM